MIVALPFHFNDMDLAFKNADWISTLKNERGHAWALFPDARVPQERIEEIKALLGNVVAVEVVYGDDLNKWPESANLMFRTATKYIERVFNKPWLWLEPDAIPLCDYWLDKIEAEYNEARKPFMGDRVEVENVPLHMSGVAVYPAQMNKHFGGAILAHEMAWDVYGAQKTINNAHWTKLIVHNWKHEAFKDIGELNNKMAQHPECVLFHSDKTGSIIDILRRERQEAITSAHINEIRSVTQAQGKDETLQKEVALTSSGGSTGNVSSLPSQTQGREGSGGEYPAGSDSIRADSQAGQVRQMSDASNGKTSSRTPQGLQSATSGSMAVRPVPSGGTQPTCDIFIKTYEKDYEWLYYCLKSIDKFAKGFRKILIVSPDKPPYTVQHFLGAKWSCGQFEWRIIEEYGEDAYLSQQVFKVYADTYTDADYILHTDSDTIFTRDITPQTYLHEEFILEGELFNIQQGRYERKPIWMMTPIDQAHEDEQHPWKTVLRDFMTQNSEYEFMRRHPFILPRWFYKEFRKFIEHVHQKEAKDYIMSRPLRSWSEFNCMGFYAWKFHRDKFHWFDTSKHPENEWPPLTVDQRWSVGGITNEIRYEWDKILSGVPERGATSSTEAGSSNLQHCKVDDVTVNGEPSPTQKSQVRSMDCPECKCHFDYVPSAKCPSCGRMWRPPKPKGQCPLCGHTKKKRKKRRKRKAKKPSFIKSLASHPPADAFHIATGL